MAALPAPSPEPIPVFINPHAGSAERVLGALDGDARFVPRPVEPPALRDEIRRAVAAGAGRIAVSGGDGTLCTASNELLGTSTELAVIPGGTLNHFARIHGIPEDPAEAAVVAATGIAKAVDVARVNERVFLGTSSVGAYITFVELRESLERWLPYSLASVGALVGLLFRLRSFPVVVEVNGVERRYRTPLVFVAVGEREGKLAALGTTAATGRSGLHVMVVRGRTRASLAALALAAAARGMRAAARTPHMDAFLVDAVRVGVSRHAVRISTDGELHRMEPPLDYRLLRGALRVVVPNRESGVGSRE